jgi:NTE family protein
MTEMRVGLALSGGGAKGAYQVGVLKALLELGAQIDAIAGASIGALNGAILASAPSIPEGLSRMEEVWLTLAEQSPLN